MRLPKYLSPTSISLFFENREEFYLKYLADERTPKIPQTQPMSVGSAFDAYIKNYLHKRLYGNEGDYSLDDLLEKQVEPQNLDWAREAGLNCFNQYKHAGGIADLLVEVEKAVDDPRFEFRVEGRVKHESNLEGIPMCGYPDLYFKLANGIHCIYDFKVNGYCSKSPVSPKPGYINCRDGWPSEVAKPTRGGPGPHKNAQVLPYHGININAAITFDDVDESWARQLTIYGWLEGVEIGEIIIGGIEQLACKPGPFVRLASHRAKIEADYQHRLFSQVDYVWRTIHEGLEYDGEIITRLPHIFDTLSKEESDIRCETLDDFHKAFQSDNPLDQWFAETHRT